MYSVEEVTKDFEVTYPVLSVDNLGRVKLVRFGDEYSAPGTCAVCMCTLSPDKVFVDLGLTVDDIGALYLCNVCMDETLKVMRAIPVDGPEFTKLFNNYTRAVAEIGRLRLEINKTQDKVRNELLADLQYYLGDRYKSGNSTNPGTVADASENTEQTNAFVNGNRAETQSGTGSSRLIDEAGTGTNYSATEPSTQQGSTKLFDLTELDKLDFNNFNF